MLPEDATQTEVKNLIMGDETVPSTVETPAVESTPAPAKVEETPAPVETKPEETPAEVPAKPVETINVDKLQQQVENLNIALKKERDEGRSETQSLRKELDDSKALLERLKGVFVPETPAAPEPTPEDAKYMTLEQVQALMEQKDQELARKTEEEMRASAIKNEITTLETKWDGKDGKPKYDDTEVLEWQKSNEKLYLSPNEAFLAMKNAEIIDWEVKQRLAVRKDTQTVETPSTTPGEHVPGEIIPKTEAETRNAVLAAMNSLEAEI